MVNNNQKIIDSLMKHFGITVDLAQKVITLGELHNRIVEKSALLWKKINEHWEDKSKEGQAKFDALFTEYRELLEEDITNAEQIQDILNFQEKKHEKPFELKTGREKLAHILREARGSRTRVQFEELTEISIVFIRRLERGKSIGWATLQAVAAIAPHTSYCWEDLLAMALETDDNSEVNYSEQQE